MLLKMQKSKPQMREGTLGWPNSKKEKKKKKTNKHGRNSNKHQ